MPRLSNPCTINQVPSLQQPANAATHHKTQHANAASRQPPSAWGLTAAHMGFNNSSPQSGWPPQCSAALSPRTCPGYAQPPVPGRHRQAPWPPSASACRWTTPRAARHNWPKCSRSTATTCQTSCCTESKGTQHKLQLIERPGAGGHIQHQGIVRAKLPFPKCYVASDLASLRLLLLPR